jgi:hypothetical protein
LEELHISGCLDAELLAAVGQHCPTVQRLHIYWPATGAVDHAANRAALKAVSAWPNLSDVELHFFPGDGPSIELLGDCSRLKRLSIEGDTFQPSPEQLRPLLRLKRLEQLEFSDCPLGDAHVPVLGQFRWLNSLQLWRTALTPRGETQLENVRTGKPLDLYVE